jgi:CheY-like chemotaxis protein
VVAVRDDLRERRRETYRMLYRLGIPYGEAVSRLAEQYDVSESAIENDVAKMSGWITDLDVPLTDGLLRLRQVREQARELEQLALQARQDEDLAEARRCREAIVKTVARENRMAQRLGVTTEAAHTVEVVDGLDPEDEELLEEWCGLTGDTVDLEDVR